MVCGVEASWMVAGWLGAGDYGAVFRRVWL